jgi:hypothetical protein
MSEDIRRYDNGGMKNLFTHDLLTLQNAELTEQNDQSRASVSSSRIVWSQNDPTPPAVL